MKWQAKMFTALPMITQAYPTHKWLALTLTWVNCDLKDLRASISDANRAFARLTELKRFPAIGWIKSVEVTRSKNGQAHPHFHVLMLVENKYFGGRNYVTQQEWRELWQRCLRVDYLPQVNIQTVKSKRDRTDDNNATKAAIVETLKYSVKAEDLVLDKDWLSELTSQLHKTRAISIGGVIKEFIKEESDDDDLVHIEDKEEKEDKKKSPEFLFGWREVVKHYTKVNTAKNGTSIISKK